MVGKYVTPKSQYYTHRTEYDKYIAVPQQIFIVVSFIKTDKGTLISMIPINDLLKINRLSEAAFKKNIVLISGYSEDFNILPSKHQKILNSIYGHD